MLLPLPGDLIFRVLKFSSWETRIQLCEEDWVAALFKLLKSEEGLYVPPLVPKKEPPLVHTGFYVSSHSQTLFLRLYRLRMMIDESPNRKRQPARNTPRIRSRIPPYKQELTSIELKHLYRGLVVPAQTLQAAVDVSESTKSTLIYPWDGLISESDNVYTWYCQQSVVDFMNGHHRVILTVGSEEQILGLTQEAINEVLSFHPSVRISLFEFGDNALLNLVSGEIDPYRETLTWENSGFANRMPKCQGSYLITLCLDTRLGPSTLVFGRLKPGSLARYDDDSHYMMSELLSEIVSPLWREILRFDDDSIQSKWWLAGCINASCPRMVIILYESEGLAVAPDEYKCSLVAVRGDSISFL